MKGDQKRNTVYIVSLFLTLAVVLWAILLEDNFTSVTEKLYRFLSVNMGWAYLLIIGLFVVFCLALAFSRYGNIRLGKDHEQPEHSTVSWFAMLFCAGMGVGLVFWGVSEPLSHYIRPDGLEGGTAEAASFAFQATFMHWGLHPWAIYGVIGLSLAYFSFRKNEKILISSTLIPILGRRRMEGFVGKCVDILTVLVTVIGIATSLGLGALQINGGLSYLTDIPYNFKTQLIIISGVTVIFLISATSGVERGIKLLSNFNLALAVIFITLAFAVGPKVETINSLISGMGAYLSGIVSESFKMHIYGDNSWIINWRVFYWAWWISWAPFVGCFIARISRGRTIREFVLGVLIVPMITSCIWFAVFGNLGISKGMDGTFSLEELQMMVGSPETALFDVLSVYPMGILLSAAAVALLFTFFITSADSGTFVLGMFTSDGKMNPRNLSKVIWGVTISLLAIGLLLTGGLTSVQKVALIIAFPFLLIMLICCLSLIKTLKKETKDCNMNR